MLTRERFDEIAARWRASGLGEVREWAYPRLPERESYMYLSLAKDGVGRARLAELAGQYALLAADSEGYMGVHAQSDGTCCVGVHASRPLTEDEIAAALAERAA